MARNFFFLFFALLMLGTTANAQNSLFMISGSAGIPETPRGDMGLTIDGRLDLGGLHFGATYDQGATGLKGNLYTNFNVGVGFNVDPALSFRLTYTQFQQTSATGLKFSDWAAGVNATLIQPLDYKNRFILEAKFNIGIAMGVTQTDSVRFSTNSVVVQQIPDLVDSNIAFETYFGAKLSWHPFQRSQVGLMPFVEAGIYNPFSTGGLEVTSRGFSKRIWKLEIGVAIPIYFDLYIAGKGKGCPYQF